MKAVIAALLILLLAALGATAVAAWMFRFDPVPVGGGGVLLVDRWEQSASVCKVVFYGETRVFNCGAKARLDRTAAGRAAQRRLDALSQGRQ